MRHLPRLPYNGLTIVLSNPSRFDKFELISGIAGHLFQTKCLGESISRYACDIRTSDTIKEGLISGTRGLFLLGDKAFKEWTERKYDNYSLNEQRGCPLNTKFNIPTICSYFPQDCIDIVNHEDRLNPQEWNNQDEGEEDNEDETKKKGRTRRHNYRFWLERDTKKLINKMSVSSDKFGHDNVPLKTRLGCSATDNIEFLEGIKNENLYMDIETTVDGGYNLLCVGVATDTSDVYVIPIFKFDGNLFYSHENTALIFKSLARAMSNNINVTHNGYGFDLPILAWRYHIPWGTRHYDTMIAHHRCFPEIEKTLGHLGSLWTDEEYHKDEGCFSPHSMEDQIKLWNYNAKDVHLMRLIKKEIDKYARKIPGLTESINQGMDTIYPYTLCSLSGIHFDNNKRNDIIVENDKLMTQYLRWLDILKGSYKDRILPTSSISCVKYFHEYLNYDIVSRSRRISNKTGKQLNTPSLNEAAIYKLKLKYPQNIMLDICIAYRKKKKETGMLGFTDWDINRLPI